MIKYYAHVHTDKDGNYGVSFPDVPGCITATDGFDNVHDQASAALTSNRAACKAEGLEFPSPTGSHLEACETAGNGFVIVVYIEHEA